MLEKDLIHHAQEMLLDGRLSYRKIAEQLGVSRSSIAKIAAARRKTIVVPKPLQISEDSWYQDEGQFTRCPGCGGMVHLPCRLCDVRAQCDQELELRRIARANTLRIAVRQILLDSLRRQNQRDEAHRLSQRKAG